MFSEYCWEMWGHKRRLASFEYVTWSEWKLLSHVWVFVTPWTVACQTPLSIELSRPEYWSGFSSPRNLPNPGMEPRSPALLLLLLSHFSRVQLCVTPEMESPSLGFSRQEHWSGLPFPSPMHESEKWKVKGKSLSHVPILATPWTAAYQTPPSMGFARQEYWSRVPSPALQEDSLPAELLGKPYLNIVPP